MSRNNTINTLALSFLLTIALVLLAPPVSAPGCCFIKSTSTCSPNYRPDLSEITQAAAACIAGDQDNRFSPDSGCIGLEECITGCCCSGKTPIFSNKGFCEGRGLVFTERTRSDCNSEFCKLAIDECPDDCTFNSQDCLNKIGETVRATNKYYCAPKDKLYDFVIDCTTECKPEVKDCQRNKAITEFCKCQGITRASGFCCSDGKHDSSQTGDSCQQNGCTAKGFVCAPSCDGLTSPEFDFGQANGCPDSDPHCCSKEAESFTACCSKFEKCNGEILPFTYANCNEDDSTRKPCKSAVKASGDDAVCARFPCAIGERINTRINKNDDFTHCFCKTGTSDEPYSLFSEDGYCCADGYKPAISGGCGIVAQGTATGKVLHSTTGATIPNANIIVEQSGSTIKTAQTGIDGTFTLDSLSPGAYTFRATQSGFLPRSTTRTIVGGQVLNNIILRIAPLQDSECDSPFPPPPQTFRGQNTKGKRQIELSWEPRPECAISINEYILSRTPAHPLGDIVLKEKAFVDTEVDWKTDSTGTYTYLLKAHYKSNKFSSTLATQVIMGNSLCEGLLGNEEFCLDQSLQIADSVHFGYTCNSNNRLKFINSKDCSTNNQVCVGPDKDNKVHCANKKICKEVEPFRPFGLYYEEESCTNSNWCYYDYSLTSIDHCNDCNEKSCFDYKSEAACNTDNCAASRKFTNKKDFNKGCQWLYTFEELGKGICFDPDFEQDNCDLCNDQASPFFNVNCKQNICSSLGSCFSKAESCQACSSQTTCESFPNKDACVGANAPGPNGPFQNIDFGTPRCRAPTTIIPSDDACNLNVCRWNDATNRCFKDGNNDLVDDCSSPENRDACRADVNIPVTVPQASIPNMNADGSPIVFTSDDDAERLFFCVDQTNTCCPTTILLYAGTSSRTASLNPATSIPGTPEGEVYYIRFYTQDFHNNVEEVQSLEFYMDKKAPETFFDYQAVEIAPDKSDVRVTLESNEFVDCDAAHSDIPFINIQGTNEFNKGLKQKKFIFEAKGLADGIYDFTTTCKDDVGNTEIRNDRRLFIDAFQQIKNPSPDFEVLKEKSITLSVETVDSSTCIATDLNPDVATKLPPITLIQQPKSGTIHSHTKTQGFADGTYHFKVACLPKEGGAAPDGTFITFTVDSLPPTTKVTTSTNPFDFAEFHKTPFKLDFECQDVDLGSRPGEFGCFDQSIKYCLSDSDCSPVFNQGAPNSLQVLGGTSLIFNFFSVDKGGNPQTLQKKVLKIDNVPPTFTVDVETRLTDKPEVEIKSEDALDLQSGFKGFNLRIVEAKNFNSQVDIPITGSVFVEDIPLFDGLNLVIVLGEDNAGNRKEFSTTILKDVFDPILDSSVKNHIGARIDSDDPSGVQASAEFKEKIVFNTKITDDAQIISSAVVVKCKTDETESCKNFQDKTVDLILEQGIYTAELTDQLPVGTYTATFVAADQFSNRGENTITFSVGDTAGPEFTLKLLTGASETPTIAFGEHILQLTASELLQSVSIDLKFDDKFRVPQTIPLSMQSADDLVWTDAFTIGQKDSTRNMQATITLDITVTDLNGNGNTGTNTAFTIDTRGPAIKGFSPPLPKTVYFKDIDISGFTEPGATVTIKVFSCTEIDNPSTCENTPYKNQNFEVPAQPTIAAQGLVDQPVEAFLGSLPRAGDTSLRFDDQSLFNQPIPPYLDFEPRGASVIPRYEILTKAVVSTDTVLTFKPPLAGNLLTIHKASTYTNPFPPGYFTKAIELKEGPNLIDVSAQIGGRQGDSIGPFIEFQSDIFDIALVDPLDNLVNFNDFVTAGNSINLQVQTRRSGVKFDAECTISHSADIVAATFEDVALPASNDFVHTFNIGSSKCAENQGSFCLIGGSQQHQSQFHRYKIKCKSTELNMPIVERDVCFKVATRAVFGNNVVGDNICGASTGCGTTIPAKCEDKVDICTTITEESICKTNFGCNWCPAAASLNAQSCTGSCATCGGLTSTSNNLCVEDTGGDGGFGAPLE